MEDFKYIFVGEKFIIISEGMWGQKSNTDTYFCSGITGKYGDKTYRFTQYGDGSVSEKDFSDVFITQKRIEQKMENSRSKEKEIYVLGYWLSRDDGNLLDNDE